MGILQRLPLARTALLLVAIGSWSSDIPSAVMAYNPAIPTNTTSALDLIPQDYIQLDWLPAGQSAFTDALSKQLVSPQTSQIAGYRGALVHYDEANATTMTTAPWVALISCDNTNSSNGSPLLPNSVDIFTQARSLGCEAAIVYSLYSQTCTFSSAFINYFNGSTMDVYVTTSVSSAQAITQQFRNVADQAYWYNSTSLSNSESGVLSIISSIGGSSATTMPSLLTSTSASTSSGALPTGVADSPSGTPVKYLIATILNVNSSGGSQVGTTQGGTSSSSGSGSANTGLAMIILYAITGCVTLLFLVVIMSGAIRAMRHPERYGPRARNRHLPGDSGQSRAGGLTKAILDTFPVVKFLSGNGSSSGAAGEGAADGDLERRLQNEQAGIVKDEEAQLETVDINSGETPGGHVAMYEIRSKSAAGSGEAVESEGIAPTANAMSGTGQTSGDRGAGSPHMGGRTEDDADTFVLGDEEEDATKDGHEPAAPTTAASGVAAVDTTNPADVNDSITCPICLLDFEDGDDIRILPCDSRHRFHDACVVPWLLNVSSLCPLCRSDLAKDPTAASGVTDTDAVTAPNLGAPAHQRDSSSTRLASQLRNLLPGLSGPGNARTNTHMSASSPMPTSSTTGPAAAHDIDAAAADVAASVTAGTAPPVHSQAPLQSRFMRYAQQRRTRVRARTNTSREPSGPQSGSQSAESQLAPPIE